MAFQRLENLARLKGRGYLGAGVRGSRAKRLLDRRFRWQCLVVRGLRGRLRTLTTRLRARRREARGLWRGGRSGVSLQVGRLCLLHLFDVLLGPVTDRGERFDERASERREGYSTVGGTVSLTTRSTSPSRSRLLKIWVSTLCEMPSIPRRSSPNRCVRWPSRPTIKAVHLSAIRSSARRVGHLAA